MSHDDRRAEAATSITMTPLAARALTYGCPGITSPGRQVWGAVPAGFRGFETTVALDRDDWDVLRAALLTWAVKTRSGFAVGDLEPAPVQPGQRLWLTAVIGKLRIREPVEVITVVDTPDRCGFAYGTLQGHPVSGEEAFIATRTPTGTASLTLRSVTRAASGPWRAVFPLALLAQRLYRRRYLRSLLPPRPLRSTDPIGDPEGSA